MNGTIAIGVLRTLRYHDLIRMRETVKAVYLIGSFARGEQTEASDVDILLDVEPSKGQTAQELTEAYRRPLQAEFMRRGIRGPCDELHPQMWGRRLDLYFTYDASAEKLPKLRL